MNVSSTCRHLRRDQTREEKDLWRILKAGRFAGFKFRRQHPIDGYSVDFYCPLARLSIELDGFQQGLPGSLSYNKHRSECLAVKGIREMRFWNRQWRHNRQGVLLEIWNDLHEQAGVVSVLRKVENHRFVAPSVNGLQKAPKKFLEARARPKLFLAGTSSPWPSPPHSGGEGSLAPVKHSY